MPGQWIRRPGVVGLLGAVMSGCAVTPHPPVALVTRCSPGYTGRSAVRYSPSRDYRLEIQTAGDDWRDGLQGAKYRMTFRDKEVWAGERDYTLMNPIVIDDGTVVGVAYRWEERKDNTPGPEKSFMHIVIIRDGRDVQDWMGEQSLPAFGSREHEEPRPYVESLLVDPANDRAIVNVVEHDSSQHGHPACWLFRLSTGVFVARIDFPRILAMLGYVDSAKVESYGGASAYITELQAVAGTPLILAHVTLPGTSPAKQRDHEKFDSLFIVVDGKGMPFWTLRVPDNITSWDGPVTGGEQTWSPSQNMLMAGKLGSFGVFRTSARQVETYRVASRGTEGWRVTKTGQMTLRQARREYSAASRPAPP